MSDERKSSAFGFWAIAVFATLIASLVVYVSAYLWMVQPVHTILSFHVASGSPPVVIEATYQWGATGSEVGNPEFWGRFFSPIHGVDRRMRHGKWTPTR